MLSHAASSAASAARRAEERAKEQVRKRLQEFKKTNSDLIFMLVLNKHTFAGDQGTTLAAEVRAARANKMTMLLVHDVDETEDGCPFDRMFQVTPAELLADNIYSQLAIAWQPPRYAGHNRVSQAMIKKALGAQFTGGSKKQLAAVAREETSEASEFNLIDEESLSRRLSALHERVKTRNSGRFSGRFSAAALEAVDAAAPAATSSSFNGRLSRLASSVRMSKADLGSGRMSKTDTDSGRESKNTDAGPAMVA